MGAFITVCIDFLSQAGLAACAIALFVRCVNMLVRAFSGKEDIF